MVHTQFTAAHQLANIATDFPLTTADLGVDLHANGNHIDIGMDNSGVSFNRALHPIRFGRGSFELSHDWNISKGNHGLVAGFNVVRKRFNNNTLFHSSGQFGFDGHVTGFGDESGFDRADFMLGAFSFFTQNSGEIEQRRGTQSGYYFGDTWKVRPGLTLNFGIRYEPYQLFADKLDRNQTFDLAANQAGIRSTDLQECPARACSITATNGPRDTAAATPSAASLPTRTTTTWRRASALPGTPSGTARPASAAATPSSTTGRR